MVASGLLEVYQTNTNDVAELLSFETRNLVLSVSTVVELAGMVELRAIYTHPRLWLNWGDTGTAGNLNFNQGAAVFDNPTITGILRNFLMASHSVVLLLICRQR